MSDDTAGLPLFGEPTLAPYRRNSATSLAAAKKVTPGVKAIHMLILAAIRKKGPMTPDECADYLAVNVLKIRPRFAELHGEKYELFLLEPTGEHRPSSLGNPMDVFRLTYKGRQHVANDPVDPRELGHVATMHRNPRGA